MQVDPTKPSLIPPVSKRLKLKCDQMLSNFAFNCNLRRYHMRKHKHGGTDKGRDGIDNFFKTHTCSPMCKLLGGAVQIDHIKLQSKSRLVSALEN